MWMPLRSACDAIREDLGQPVRLRRLLDEDRSLRAGWREPAAVVAASSVVDWHDWGDAPALHWPRRKRGTLSGWRYQAGHYSSIQVHRPEFEHFGRCAVTDLWQCDIQTVVGLAASKSELRNFVSLDDMVEANSRKMIDEISDAALQRNLAHDEIRILHRESNSDHFARHLWDGRVFLINSGGSHHFAAARYIAARLGRSVPLRGALRTYSLDPEAVLGLRRDFELFAVSDDAVASNGFHDAMRAFKASYLWQHLPRPHDTARAVLLPRSEARSAKIAQVLREAGMFDLGAFLGRLVEKQCAMEQVP